MLVSFADSKAGAKHCLFPARQIGEGFGNMSTDLRLRSRLEWLWAPPIFDKLSQAALLPHRGLKRDGLSHRADNSKHFLKRLDHFGRDFSEHGLSP